LAEASGGTLFLDEINSLSLSAQGKFLRFLQDKEYRPLGSAKNQVADVRIVAATNSDLRKQVEEKVFRVDLFHRLNILSLSIPPLRERPEDIPLLVQHFLQVYGRQYGRGEVRCYGEALQKLLDYDWPGNVRELQGVIQRAVILTSSPMLGPDDIDVPIGEKGRIPVSRLFQEGKAHAIEQFERSYLSAILAMHAGNVSQASKTAGTERRSFQRLLKKHGLDRRIFQRLGNDYASSPNQV
jgi:DNA-binding NtrC family response regulator